MSKPNNRNSSEYECYNFVNDGCTMGFYYVSENDEYEDDYDNDNDEYED